MRSVLREMCRERLLALPRTADAHPRGSQPYVTAVLDWMEQTEHALEPLRSPVVARVAAARAGVQAASDGFRLQESPGETSRRRARRAAATSGLREASQAVTSQLEVEDAFFAEITEKMAQLLAVALLSHPLPPMREPRDRWLDEVWARLDNGEGTAGMRSYLSIRLDRTDRNYVLDDLLRNLASNP